MPKPKYCLQNPRTLTSISFEGALGDLVDGHHFFDIFTKATIYEVL
jgi:hypothetical protein